MPNKLPFRGWGFKQSEAITCAIEIMQRRIPSRSHRPREPPARRADPTESPGSCNLVYIYSSGSKSNVAMNAWLPQASYPCGNFSGTSSLELRGTKGSIGHTFMVCIHTENQNQGDFYPFVLLEISVLDESPLGHLRYLLTDVPPQPNSPPDNVFNPDRPAKDLEAKRWNFRPSSASSNK